MGSRSETTKPKRGRPFRLGERASKMVAVRMTPSEADQLDSDRGDESGADWIRGALDLRREATS